MGTSSSRMGGFVPNPPPSRSHIRRHRSSSFKRTVSSVLTCGACSSSSRPPCDEVEDDLPEILVNNAEDCDLEKIQFLAKNSALSTGTEPQYSNLRIGTRVLSETTTLSRGNSSMAGNSVAGDKGESLCQNLESSPETIANEKASPSCGDESSSDSVTANDRTIMDVVNSGNRITNRNESLNCPGHELYYPSSDGLEESSDEVSVENLEREMLVFHDCDTASASASVISDSLIDSPTLTSSPGLGSLASEREQSHRNANVLQVDVGSFSSNTPLAGSSESGNHEGRQNSRTLFWDAFSRRSSRRNTDSRTSVFTNDDTDDVGSQDRWLLDFSSDLFDDGIGGGSRLYGNSNQISSERRWHSSSEIWERFRDVGHNRSGRRTAICPLGIHPDGTCACGSTLRAEESGTRASISRIVMLAEALFEVLDEIHRQPMSLSLSVVSLPAPESVVDSFPVKYYRKPERPESGDNVAQCYICLAEYDEGDKIRVLPCHHEFHASCVDKWLKEIHSVCPLCRGDVREGIKESSVSSSGTLPC